MSLINIQNLTFSYEGSDKNVFENATFQIDTDWKLGLVGRNGRGKTTFLNLLLHKFEYSGKISSSVNFTYFPFEIADQEVIIRDLLLEICPNAEEWQIIRELKHLQLDSYILDMQYNYLSGGEKTKVLLAGLFLKENNYLLIDEPTNHLDSTGRKVVADYLKKKKSFILVSHDRYFLDSCTDHTLSINKNDIEVCQGSFSVWKENFDTRQAFEQAKNEQLKKEIDRLTKSAKRTSDWANKTEASKYGNGPVDRGFIGHKAAKMMKQAKVTEARQQRAIEQKSSLLQNVERTANLTLSPLAFRTNRLVNIALTSINFGSTKIDLGMDFEIVQGDRILLDGNNGSGKSSILKIIAGEQIDYTGKINIPNDLIISYLPQNYEFEKGTISDFAKANNLDESIFRSKLCEMGIGKEDFIGDISNLSAGQKRKILLAKSLTEKAHLYIWDEPLNYLDIYTRMQVEKVLLDYKPTMIFVEHDITFGGTIATKTIKIWAKIWITPDFRSIICISNKKSLSITTNFFCLFD